MGAGCSSECLFDVTVGHVQCAFPPGCKIHILMKVRKHGFHVSLIKVPYHSENSPWMCRLQLTDGVVHNIQGFSCVSTGGNEHCYEDDNSEFPG